MSIELVNFLQQLDGSATFDSLSKLFDDKLDTNITLKRITEDGNLILIHNDFNSRNNSQLENDCRSFVVDITDLKARIIMYSHGTVEYSNIESFAMEAQPDNIEETFEDSYEGTMISIFNNKDKWYFTTSRCTSIDSSYYYKSNITFGNMFDECLLEMSSKLTRDAFTELLDKTKCYNFSLIHHNNKFIVDYSNIFGENYKKLALIDERNVDTLLISHSDLSDVLPDLIIIKRYGTLLDAKSNMIHDNEGIIYKKHDVSQNRTIITKIQTQSYIDKHKRRPNYSNNWYSYIHIFFLNDKSFTIEDFIKENDIEENVIIDGKNIDIVGMIHLLCKHTAKIMTQLIMHFTTFNEDNYEKINQGDYELIQGKSFNVMRRQIATIQNLIHQKKIKYSTQLISHIRNYVSVSNFVNLLHSILDLKNNTTLITFTDDYYEKYLNFIVQKTMIQNREIE